MQSFDREIQSLIFPGNKATDQNKFDNCESAVYLRHRQAALPGKKLSSTDYSR